MSFALLNLRRLSGRTTTKASFTKYVQLSLQFLRQSISQRFPKRESHGDIHSDAAGTETDKDVNAMLMYHRVGTEQCECIQDWLHRF